MSVHALKNEFISVSKESIISYGGNQTWSENAVIRRCGCGVIGSLDLLLYLSRYHCGGQAPETRPIPLNMTNAQRCACTIFSPTITSPNWAAHWKTWDPTASFAAM